MDIELDRGFEYETMALAVHQVRQIAETVAGSAARHCPGRPSGPLVQSIRTDPTDQGADVSIGTDHWSYMEYGTPPHVIEAGPRPEGARGALSWPGAEHPVGRVHHPGTPEYAMMRQALYEAQA